MTVWHTARTMRWSTKAVIAAGLLAVLLVASVPVALLVGLFMMMLGHVVAGLALFGGSILVAIAGVAIAGLSGVRHVRKLVRQQSQRIVQLRRGDYNFD
jgi:positive regulator of sigma E activity